MKKLAIVFTMVAMVMMSSLTVQAKEGETSQEKIQRMLNNLEDAERPAGKAYPNEKYIAKGYAETVENKEEFISELMIAVEEYNSCHQKKIEVDYEIMRDDYISVDFYSENLYYIENTPIYIGKVAYVREGEWNYWESSENFGSGKSGNIETSSAVIVTGVSYLNEEGNIISSSSSGSERIQVTELRMLHISSIEGEELGWIWPLCLVDPGVVDPD